VIERALDDPTLKQGAERIARALSRSDGALTIADEIERLDSARGSPAPPVTRP
jgi:UDP:flavonoid glycosyltransferase YjiC (YdhE family)